MVRGTEGIKWLHVCGNFMSADNAISKKKERRRLVHTQLLICRNNEELAEVYCSQCSTILGI